MARKNRLIPLLCLSILLAGCNPGSPMITFCAGFGVEVSDGKNSNTVTSVTWSNTFITFVVDLNIPEVHISEVWICNIFFGFNIDDGDFISCPFNKSETNFRNETQILDDNLLEAQCSYTFVFDQMMDSPSSFIEHENAYLQLNLFVCQSGYSATEAWIENQDVTFEME